jgi:hypothetical protein
MFSPLRHKCPYQILTIVLMPFGFLAHKDLNKKSLNIPKGNQNPYVEEEQTTQWPREKVIWLSNIWTLSVPDESVFQLRVVHT